MTPVFSVPLPGYHIDSEPDYTLGEQVDRVIREHFDLNRIIIRAVSSADHPGRSLDELTEIVRERGTDRYDPDRKGVLYEQFEPYHPDFHGGPFGVGEGSSSFFGGVMRHFFEDAPADRGYPLRIDLLLVYDREQLERADKADPGRPRVRPRLESFLFRFKFPERKMEALLGLIKIPA